MSLRINLSRAAVLAASAGVCLGVSAQPAPPPAAQIASQAASRSAAQAAAAPAQIKPGVWEISTVVDDPANHSQHSAVSRSCVAPAEVANPQRLVPVQREAGMQCDNHDAKRDGSAITWTVACKSATATASGSGKLVLSALGYVGRGELEVKKAGAKPIKLKQTFTGKWVEACN